MKQMLKLIFVLTIICLVAGLLLAWVNDLTGAPIKAALLAEKTQAIKEVLPDCDNDPTGSVFTPKAGGPVAQFFVARKEGCFAGAAFAIKSSKGYGGDIEIMVGVNAQGKVQAIKILNHKETPGLGAKIGDPSFRSEFSGKPVKTTRWKVKKDGGDIQEITAATISSRAVTQAVQEGLAEYLKNATQIQMTGEGS